MANAPLSNHVRIYGGALSQDHCRALIERFESSPDQVVSEREGGHSFVQVDVTQNWPDEHSALVPVLLSHFAQYQRALNAAYWPPKFAFEHLRVKRYLPNGRDSFPPHVDVMCHDAARRFMTAIVYLNAPEEGGETVFTDLDLSIAPETGKLLAFPPLWLFPHAGLAPRSGPKYILHTYLCYPA